LKDYFAISDQGALSRKSGKDSDFVSALESGALDVGGKIPNTFKISDVSSIANSAFYGCGYLKNSSSASINTLQFILPSTNTTLFAASNAFRDCTNLRRIEFDTSSADATVSIAANVFNGCANLTGLWKTSNDHQLYLSSIDSDAFSDCASLSIDGMKGIVVSESGVLKKVENKNTDGTTIGVGIFNSTLSYANCMITGDMGNKLDNYFTTTINDYVFRGCASLTSLDLSGSANSLTTIGSAAFNRCAKLTTIGLSKLTALTTIGSSAFSDCAAITTIDLSPLTNLTSINSNAFDGCTSLTTLKLPPAMFATDNQASINSSAFGGCTKLSNIYLPTNAATLPKTCDSNAFTNCPVSGTI
jgi:hypothetical protein